MADQPRDDSPVPLTSNQGVRVPDDHHSLKAGERGPTLLEDFFFREKMMHFDHERIPERIVHARGSAAHGFFQVYEPLTDYTMAQFLQDPAITTPVFVRFSTVAGFRGSADTVRDARGFATKFYTQDGTFDLVGNNIPVFFIQDAIKFPDLVHAVKPEPHHEMPQASAAHDNFWDFISLMPESMHMVMWVLSDRGIPRSYRMMEGFGVHTFRLINAEGVSRFVKFHWKPLLGMHALAWDEAQKIAGKDPDFNRRDLWEAIEHGNYPEYELGLQIIEEADAESFDFDLLDPTKIVPEELVPVRRVGKMVLNRNPDNFFAETEQVAFHPGHIVRGIDFTNDPLLQGRLFSYLDTQLIRLGGPNFAELPINRPHADVHNYQRDGYMRHTVNQGRVNYEPNSLGKGCPMHDPSQMQRFMSYAEAMNGSKIRARGERFNDHFSQATLFWNSQSPAEQRHIIQAFQFELGKVEHMHIRERIVALVANIDETLAAEVAKGIGVTSVTTDLSYLQNSSAPQPSSRRGAAAPGTSPALSMENTPKDSIRSRMIAILAMNGVDDSLIDIKSKLEQAGGRADVISKHHGTLTTATGQSIMVDKTFLTTGSIVYDAVYIPGGAESAKALAATGAAVHFVNEAFKHCKPIGVTDDGIEFVRRSAIPADYFVDSGTTNTLKNESGVVSIHSAADLNTFAQSFIAAIAQHRFWERETLEHIPA